MTETVTCYHGTSSNNVPAIVKHGLTCHHEGADTWAVKHGLAVGKRSRALRKPSVYVTTRRVNAVGFAKYAAEISAGEPALISLEVPRDAWESAFKPDEFSDTSPAGEVTNWRTETAVPAAWVTDHEIVTAEARDVTNETDETVAVYNLLNALFARHDRTQGETL